MLIICDFNINQISTVNKAKTTSMPLDDVQVLKCPWIDLSVDVFWLLINNLHIICTILFQNFDTMWSLYMIFLSDRFYIQVSRANGVVKVCVSLYLKWLLISLHNSETLGSKLDMKEIIIVIVISNALRREYITPGWGVTMP